MPKMRSIVFAAAVAAAMAVPSPAQAGPTSSTTAIASLGDSYISGEAGRWRGNSNNPNGTRDWTDRAAVCPNRVDCTYDPSVVYGGSAANGCHRSDTAEIRSAKITVDYKLNFACSGGTTDNVFRSSNGGQTFKGESPQADQLAYFARALRVRMVVLSIGGNDLGFASIVQACLTAYVSKGPKCQPAQQKLINQKFVGVLGKVDKAIKEVRAVMTQSGYTASQYKLVVQSYPSVIPRASENRYAESDPQRAAVGGCPFYDSDSNWARDSVVPQIANGLKSVVSANGAQFLDLRDELQGREFCSTSAQQATITQAPNSATNEWGRFLQQGTVIQGELQETFHPNAYAQIATGTCLTLLFAQTGPAYKCTNVPGQGYNTMKLTASG